jgi:ankyrin repeat protein
MVIERALSYGVPSDVNHVLPNGDTALCIAAFHGCTTAVDYLLGRGANPDLTGARGLTPLDQGLRGYVHPLPGKVDPEPEELEEAWSRGLQYVEVLLRLLDRGAHPRFNLLRNIAIDVDLDQSNPNAVSAVLDVAVLTFSDLLPVYQLELLIRVLVRKGVSPDVFNTHWGNNSESYNRKSALSWAVSRYCQGTGSLRFIDFLLDHGADIRLGVDAREPWFNTLSTALGIAIDTGRADLTQHLLSRGAYPEFTRGDELSLLLMAIWCRSGHDTLVSVLLEAQADPNYMGANDYPNMPLVEAVRRIGDYDYSIKVVSMLLGHGANPNLADGYGQTPLGAALTVVDVYDRRSIVSLLLDRGADPNLVGRDGVKPLTAAVFCQDWSRFEPSYTSEQDRLSIIDMLIEAGAAPIQGDGVSRSLRSVLTGRGDRDIENRYLLEDLKLVDGLYMQRLAQIHLEFGSARLFDQGVSGALAIRTSLRPALRGSSSTQWRNKLVLRLLMAGAEVSGIDILWIRAAIYLDRDRIWTGVSRRRRGRSLLMAGLGMDP